jgi:hypothetical protein
MVSTGAPGIAMAQPGGFTQAQLVTYNLCVGALSVPLQIDCIEALVLLGVDGPAVLAALRGTMDATAYAAVSESYNEDTASIGGGGGGGVAGSPS